MTYPYATATSGQAAREEIRRILQRFGCESLGFMDKFDRHAVILAFEWRGRQVHLEATAQGWANAYLRENPWTDRKRISRKEWEDRALSQGMIAVNSILRDWVKGQMTAIETGILTFDRVFFPFMLTADGRPVIEEARKLLLENHGE